MPTNLYLCGKKYTMNKMKCLILIGVALVVCFACYAQKRSKGEWHVPGKMWSLMAPYGWEDRMKNVVSPIERKYQHHGPCEVARLQIALKEKSVKKLTVWYPKGMMNETKRYPMVIMANGTGVPATTYASVFEHLASWGFIVVGNQDKSSGSGKSTSLSLDFMLRENERAESPFYHRIDTGNIGIAGHSQGGAAVFTSITQWENGKRFKAAVTESPAHKELANFLKADYDISKVDIPLFITASTGLMGFLHDPDDGKGNRICSLADMRGEMRDIHKAHPSVPVVIARLSDSSKGHGDNLMESEPYLAAWFAYWLKGDKDAGKAFFGDNPEISSNKRWRDADRVP